MALFSHGNGRVACSYTRAGWLRPRERTFNPGGAVDTLLARRRAGLELRAQRSGNRWAVDTDGVGPGFYKLAGIVLIISGVALMAFGMLLMPLWRGRASAASGLPALHV